MDDATVGRVGYYVRMFEPMPEVPGGDPAPEDVEFVRPSSSEWLVSACAQVPGVGLLDTLGEVVVGDLSADEAVTFLQQMQRAVAWLAGAETRARAAVTSKVVTEVRALFAADAERDRLANEVRVAQGLAPAPARDPARPGPRSPTGPAGSRAGAGATGVRVPGAGRVE